MSRTIVEHLHRASFPHAQAPEGDRAAGYYVVTPEATADAPKIKLFREWLLQSATPGALAHH